MQAVITGSTGYLGSHFSRILDDEGIDTILYTSVAQTDRKYVLYENNYYDYIRDNVSWSSISSIDVLYHFGGWVPKGGSEMDSDKAADNVLFTLKLFDSLPVAPKKIVFISSMSVYGLVNTDDKITEDVVPHPQNRYAQSKLFAEILIRKWADSHGSNLDIYRVGNVYGPGDEKYPNVIPVITRNIISHNEITLINDGEEKRHYLYVDDCCSAIYDLSLSGNNGIVNVCSEKPISIRGIVEKLVRISGYDKKIARMDRNGVCNENYSNRKMREILPSFVETSLENGLTEEYNYLKEEV